MNVERLQAVKAAILAHPREFDMNYWVRITLNYEAENCLTTHCIAGWTVSLFRPAYAQSSIFIRLYAVELLELTENQSETLFYVNYWFKDFGYRYKQAHTISEQAQVAAEYIDYYIKYWADADLEVSGRGNQPII